MCHLGNKIFSDVARENFPYGFKGALRAPDRLRAGVRAATREVGADPTAAQLPGGLGSWSTRGTVKRQAPTPPLGPSGHGGVGALQAAGNEMLQPGTVTCQRRRSRAKAAIPPAIHR
jgi:hypothetical protein